MLLFKSREHRNGDLGKEDELDELTTKEVSRLIDWLKEHGHSPEEIEDCIDSISLEPGKAQKEA